MKGRSCAPVALVLLLVVQAGAQSLGVSRVPKPALGTIGSSTGRLSAVTKGPGTEAYDPANAIPLLTGAAPKRPTYGAPKPDLNAFTKQWQDALKAAGPGATDAGTWSINDMVKALQGTFNKMAEPTNVTLPINASSLAGIGGANLNATELAAAEAAAAAAHAAATNSSGVTFAEFAGSLVCKEGLKLANCSGVNPCQSHKCMVGSMCMVDMCGERCTAKCISYAELGAGLNKVMASVGLSAGLGANVPTPNLPAVDKFVGGMKSLTRSLLPKCAPNTVLDLAAFGCKACAAGSVAPQGATMCAPCGAGKYADLRTASCRACGPGSYAPLATGNANCWLCPTNTYADRSGQAACAPCAPGFSTRGLKGQRACTRLVGPSLPQ